MDAHRVQASQDAQDWGNSVTATEEEAEQAFTLFQRTSDKELLRQRERFLQEEGLSSQVGRTKQPAHNPDGRFEKRDRGDCL